MHRRPKDGVILASVLAAGFATAGFADHEMWLPAIGCIAYTVFVFWKLTRKKPRRARRGKQEDIITKKPLYTYSTVRGGWRQEWNEHWRA